jgi:hypothetical protein
MFMKEDIDERDESGGMRDEGKIESFYFIPHPSALIPPCRRR